MSNTSTPFDPQAYEGKADCVRSLAGNARNTDWIWFVLDELRRESKITKCECRSLLSSLGAGDGKP